MGSIGCITGTIGGCQLWGFCLSNQPSGQISEPSLCCNGYFLTPYRNFPSKINDACRIFFFFDYYPFIFNNLPFYFVAGRELRNLRLLPVARISVYLSLSGDFNCFPQQNRSARIIGITPSSKNDAATKAIPEIRASRTLRTVKPVWLKIKVGSEITAGNQAPLKINGGNWDIPDPLRLRLHLWKNATVPRKKATTKTATTQPRAI